MKKCLTIIIVFFISFFSLPAYSAGSNYINELSHYALWNKSKKITVWVQPCEYSRTVYKAFQEWMIAAGGCVKFIDAKDKEDANITVSFVPAIDGLKVGVTHQHTIGPYMVKADVRLRYKDFNNRKISQEKMYAVAVHEIGHALGIMGHSSNRNDIMYPTTDVIGIHASNRDVNTIRTFYCSGKY